MSSTSDSAPTVGRAEPMSAGNWAFYHFFGLIVIPGSPDTSNPKLGTSTKETAAVGRALEISPESSSQSSAVTIRTDPAAVSLIIILIQSPQK